MSLIDALRSWTRRPSAPDAGRWVVMDVESSGLDPRRDRLLAIAAIAVRTDGPRPRIDLADSFEQVLQQPASSAAPDRGNILLHGIGVGAQRAGVPRREALQAFRAYVAGAPLIAFHAAFDQTLIDRAYRAEALPALACKWLDLAPLAAVLQPTVKARSLDEWMQALGIHCVARHQAAADTLATAELLLKLWPSLRAELPQPTFGAALSLAAQRRWLAPPK